MSLSLMVDISNERFKFIVTLLEQIKQDLLQKLMVTCKRSCRRSVFNDRFNC